MALFASTSAAEGAKVFKKCAACHSISEGGGNKIGPALWGVLERPAGSLPDYKYSKAMAAYEKKWSVEDMKTMSNDIVSNVNRDLAKEITDLIEPEVDSLNDPLVKKAFDILRSWDGEHKTSDVA